MYINLSHSWHRPTLQFLYWFGQKQNYVEIDQAIDHIDQSYDMIKIDQSHTKKPGETKKEISHYFIRYWSTKLLDIQFTGKFCTPVIFSTEQKR